MNNEEFAVAFVWFVAKKYFPVQFFHLIEELSDGRRTAIWNMLKYLWIIDDA